MRGAIEGADFFFFFKETSSGTLSGEDVVEGRTGGQRLPSPRSPFSMRSKLFALSHRMRALWWALHKPLCRGGPGLCSAGEAAGTCRRKAARTGPVQQADGEVDVSSQACSTLSPLPP